MYYLLEIKEIVSIKEVIYLIAISAFFWFQKRKNDSNAETVKKDLTSAAKDVKSKIDIVNDDIKKIKKTTEETSATTDIIHKLSNNQLGIALRATADALQTIANLTKKPKDIDAAQIAKEAADSHDERQKIVDAEINRKSK